MVYYENRSNRGGRYGCRRQSKEDDCIDKLIAIAYFYGAETATKRLCDEYNKRAQEAVERAIDVLGTLAKPVYDPYYSMDMINTFGDDETKL